MSNRNPDAARMFESLAVLHLCSQPEVQYACADQLQSEVCKIAGMRGAEFSDFLAFADVQRTQVRTLDILASAPRPSIDERSTFQRLAQVARERVRQALIGLNCVVTELQRTGAKVLVIKSLDHWPDIGSDLDLFIEADASEICRILTQTLHASVEPQSWGDKLAGKWNFRVPGLEPLVEIHVNRLGQTGEQAQLPKRLLERSITSEFGGFEFQVPAPEERIALATLQRMYRHFYVRLTDIVNITRLVRGAHLDFSELQKTANTGSLWPGMATLLQIVSDYNTCYADAPLDLSTDVRVAARFGNEVTYVGERFLRVPMVPQATSLYMRQWARTGAEHKYEALFRLTLLPVLAAAAYVNLQLTGNDKGIW
jgi:hypothetical protein